MLYEKCRKMLISDISMKLSDLVTIRVVLSLTDEECQKLSLIDIEMLWSAYEDWHDRDIPVAKDCLKQYIDWIAKGLISPEKIQNIYADIDKIYDTEG